MRTAAVLEPATLERGGTVMRRVIWLSTLVVACVIAFGIWIGSRSYFVNAKDGAETVRVYHGGSFSIFGIDLYREWGDTRVPVDRTTSPPTPAMNTSVTGQGDAVSRAVAIIWASGLPTIPAITPPPQPTTPANRRAQAQA